jgi:hypothetical protein
MKSSKPRTASFAATWPIGALTRWPAALLGVGSVGTAQHIDNQCNASRLLHVLIRIDDAELTTRSFGIKMRRDDKVLVQV